MDIYLEKKTWKEAPIYEFNLEGMILLRGFL